MSRLCHIGVIIQVGALLMALATYAQPPKYLWPDQDKTGRTIESVFETPPGFERVKAPPGSFANWLRHLPLQEENAPVLECDGSKDWNQWVHEAVIDIDVGTTDLQQCADAVMRLRAEYLYSLGNYDRIAFNFTSGDRATYRKWISGYRPVVKGNDVSWKRSAKIDSSYASFRRYLDIVFTYAGTYSLRKELKTVESFCNVQIGDVIIQGGFPGHAVIVVDVAVNQDSGERRFMIAQGFTPAQSIHVLERPCWFGCDPWYDCDFSGRLKTPEWTFDKTDLKRF